MVGRARGGLFAKGYLTTGVGNGWVNVGVHHNNLRSRCTCRVRVMRTLQEVTDLHDVCTVNLYIIVFTLTCC